MQPRVVQVGPLVAGTNTKIALAQTLAAAGYVVTNGATGTFTANNICLSQSGTAATALTINGALAQTAYVAPTLTTKVAATTIASIPSLNMTLNQSSTTDAYQPDNGRFVYITSAGDDSGVTWTLVGVPSKHNSGKSSLVTETFKGTNTSVSRSQNSYTQVISITPSGNTASTVTVGTVSPALLDAARRIIFVSSGTDTGLTAVITGTDWAGDSITETITLGSSGVNPQSVNDYLTVTNIKVSGATAGTLSVGTNGVASSPWIYNDIWAAQALTGQCVVSGTVNYTVQVSMDDPDSYSGSIAPQSMTWDGTSTGVVAATTSQTFSAQPTQWVRVLLNSNTNPGYVRMTVGQFSAVPY